MIIITIIITIFIKTILTIIITGGRILRRKVISDSEEGIMFFAQLFLPKN